MQLRQSYKGGIHTLKVHSLEQTRSIVALLNICYSYSVIMAKKQDTTVREMSFAIADNHELYGILRDMLLEFGDCIFTLNRDGMEWIINPDYLEFEKEGVI